MRRTLLFAATALAGFTISAPLQAQSASEDESTGTQAESAASDGASADQAQAAPADDTSGVGVILVTAQRRSENLQDVPIAVSAFSPDQLQARGVSSTLDVAQYVPNFVALNNTGLGSSNAFFIRGMGNTESIPTFDPPVGTYVDDIYLSRQNANNISLFDVERVEVLRGPQGTLFGRNTTGGAVNVILREPDDEFGGYMELGYGRFDKKVVRGSVDVPVVDTLAVKVSGYWQDDDGYAKNITTGDRLNDEDGWGLRLGIKGELSPSVRWNGSYARIVANGENILNYDCNPADPTDCDGRFVTTGLPEGGTADSSPYAPLDIRGRKANYLLGNRTGTDLVTSDFEIDLSDNVTVNLITGFVNQTQQYGMDFYDGRTAPTIANPYPTVTGYSRGGFVILNDGQHEQFSQEVKFTGSLADGFVDFVGGAFYLVEENRTDFADLFSLSENVQLLLADRILRNKAEALAGYAQTDFNITDQFKLTAGVRYTDETKTIDISDNRAQCNASGPLPANCLDSANLIAPSGLEIPNEQSVGIWTPRFAVSYEPNRSLLLFASATRGFKSGGWNARGSTPATLLPFGPEKVWSYEAGVKSDLFNRILRANVTFFWMDVKDLQTPSGLVGPTGAITFLTRNFADYQNKGVEAEFILAPMDGLNLYANVGYQDDKYVIDRDAPAFDEYGIQSVAAQQAACLEQLAAGNVPGGPGAAACGAGIITVDGEIASPVRTPDWTLAFGGSYEAELGSSGMTLVPSVNATYRSEQWVSTSNFTIYSGEISGANGTFPANPFDGNLIAGAYSKALWTVNAGLSLNGPDNDWQLSLQCTNCFDATSSQTSLANTTYINPPMRWMVRARHNF